MTVEQLPLIADATAGPSRNTPLLVPVTCRRCTRHLLDVLVGAEVLCPSCSVWTVAGQQPATAPSRRRDARPTKMAG